jgi:hypothetical protein
LQRAHLSDHDLLAALHLSTPVRSAVDPATDRWKYAWRLIVAHLAAAREYAQSVARNHRSLGRANLAELLDREWLPTHPAVANPGGYAPALARNHGRSAFGDDFDDGLRA